MSLAIAGIVRIIDEPVENTFDNGVYFNFSAETKDRRKKGGRMYYKIGLFVPKDKLDVAREDIKKGTSIQIVHGDLDGKRAKNDPNIIYNQVKTCWANIEVLVMALRGEIQ